MTAGHGLSDPPIKLEQDTVWVVKEKRTADRCLRVGEGIPGNCQLHSLRNQVFAQVFDIPNTEEQVADPYLVQLYGVSVRMVAGMAGQDQRRGGVAFAVGDVYGPAGLALVLVYMGQPTLGRVLYLVHGHLHAQDVIVKGQGLFHIPYANGYVGNSGGIHNVFRSLKRRLG